LLGSRKAHTSPIEDVGRDSTTIHAWPNCVQDNRQTGAEEKSLNDGANPRRRCIRTHIAQQEPLQLIRLDRGFDDAICDIVEHVNGENFASSSIVDGIRGNRETGRQQNVVNDWIYYRLCYIRSTVTR
jgi:hypothetical protein